MVEGTIFSKGALGKVAGVIFVIETASAKIFSVLRAVQGDTRMTVCFKWGLAMGTGDRRSVIFLATTGTIWHGREFLVQKRKHKVRNLYGFRSIDWRFTEQLPLAGSRRGLALGPKI